MSNRQKRSRIGDMLEDYARAVPDNLDLWPAMRDRLDPAAKRRRPRDRRIPSWWIAIPACLLLVVVAASALMPQILTPAVRPTAVPAPAGSSRLFKMAADGSGQALLVGDDGQEYGEPAWSPDGSQIAYSVGLTQSLRVELVGSNGGDRRVFLAPGSQAGLNLTEGPPAWSDPTWFPFGGYLLVTARWHLSLALFNYSLQNVDDLTLMSGNNGADNIQPTWSPDGTMVAFVSNRDGNNEIYLNTAGRNGELRLTTNPEEDLAPAWSPDSKRIIFSSALDGNQEIYTMNFDGSDQQRLTTNDVPDTSPIYSPDGLSIAFASKRGADWEIYRMDADGGNVVNLTNSPSTDDGMRGLDWSPDGKEIVYSSVQRGVR